MENNIGKNIWYASLSNLLPSFFTYIFIFVTASVAGAHAVGVVSAISAFVMIIATINVLDVSLGMKRQLGIAIATGDFRQFKQVLTAAIIFVSLTTAASILVLLIPGLNLLELVGIERQYLPIVMAFVAAMGFRFIFSEALVASLNSQKLVLPIIFGSLVRFPILFGTIYWFNTSIMGIVLAYTAMIFISTTTYAVNSLQTFRKSVASATEHLYPNIKSIIQAGLSSWIPHMISVLGSQLGIIAVFSIIGSGEGGKFYIAMSILTALLFVVTGITRVSHALVAGMENEDKRRSFVSSSLKIAYMLTMPLSVPLFFFAGDYLSLVNREFGVSYDVLRVFMLSLPLVIFSEILYYYAYGIGDNKSVLFQGIIGNVPRIVLYLLLIPTLGIVGGSLAYLAGSSAEFVFALYKSRKYSIPGKFTTYAILIAIPYIIGLMTWVVNLQFVISTAIILAGTIMISIRLHLFTESDLSSIVYSVLPSKAAQKAYPPLSKVVRILS